jgi:hypothetical protein
MTRIDKIIRMGKARGFKLPYTLVAVSPAAKDEDYHIFVAENSELDSEGRRDEMIGGTAPIAGLRLNVPVPPFDFSVRRL